MLGKSLNRNRLGVPECDNATGQGVAPEHGTCLSGSEASLVLVELTGRRTKRVNLFGICSRAFRTSGLLKMGLLGVLLMKRRLHNSLLVRIFESRTLQDSWARC